MGSGGVRYSVEVKKNNLNSDKLIIGFCPDWRTDPYNGELVYIGFIWEQYMRLFQTFDIQMHLLKFDDTVDEIKDKIHGWIIPGGRDIDPKFYGQENTASEFVAKDAEKRWNFCRKFLDNANPKMPILGICYGMQVLNCLFGGDMIQDLPNGYSNHYCRRKLRVEPGSHLDKSLAGTPCVGNCYHHQGVGKIPDCLSVTAWDTLDGYPHALEYNKSDRMIMSVLWHPEGTTTSGSKLDPASNKLFEYFFTKCREYKQSK